MRAPLIAAAAVALALAGCGDDSEKKPKILNTERVERAIEQSILQKRHLVSMVSCPPGVELDRGKKFRCTASYKGGRTTFLVTQTDGRGGVRYVGLRK